MDNQVSTSSRAVFVWLAIIILLGALVAVWYSRYWSDPVGSDGVTTTSTDKAAQARQKMMEALPAAGEESATTRQASLQSLNKVKVDTSAAAAAKREELLNSLPSAK